MGSPEHPTASLRPVGTASILGRRGEGDGLGSPWFSSQFVLLLRSHSCFTLLLTRYLKWPSRYRAGKALSQVVHFAIINPPGKPERRVPDPEQLLIFGRHPPLTTSYSAKPTLCPDAFTPVGSTQAQLPPPVLETSGLVRAAPRIANWTGLRPATMRSEITIAAR